VPVHVYVVNEDQHGNGTLLYPLPGASREPLATSLNTLPGLWGQQETYWQVTTPGEREYFVIFVSPQPLDDVERIVGALPAPRFDTRVLTYTPLSPPLNAALRSVGGLVAGPRSSDRLSARYTTPLLDAPEDVQGAWVRQISFENLTPPPPAQRRSKH
jgi:hypothetical protein